MKEFLQKMLTEPWFIGFLIGLIPAFFAWKNGVVFRFHAKKQCQNHEKELSELRQHLQTQLTINASGQETLTRELESLRAQNETLRINLAAAQQKPGRAEIRQLQILESALRTMREQAPGFAPVWERVLREAEEQAEKQNQGLLGMMRQILPSIGSTKLKADSE
jgi:DNA anti-recombination protein RmuC